MRPSKTTTDRTWSRAQRRAQIDVRRYNPGEDLAGVSIRPGDTPENGGYIARNPNDHSDQWYITAKYFNRNYELK